MTEGGMPEDLVPFAADAYWRLFASANAAVWPVQPLLLAAGAVGVLWLLRGPRPSWAWLGPALGAALGCGRGCGGGGSSWRSATGR